MTIEIDSDDEIIKMTVLLHEFFDKHKSCDNEIIKVCVMTIALACKRQLDPKYAFDMLALAFENIEEI